MKRLIREFNSTDTYTIRNIFRLTGARVSDAVNSVSECSVVIKKDFDSPALLTLTKTGGRVEAVGDLIRFQLVKGVDFTNLVARRNYVMIISMILDAKESVGGKLGIYFEKN